MRQQENRAGKTISSSTRPDTFDAIRVEQFLDLQRDLLLAGADTDTLPERLVQRVAVFLGVGGAAVGVIEDDVYRLLATYGVGPDYTRRYNGVRLGESELSPALTGGRPLVLHDVDGGVPVKTLVLPFRPADTAGALHLVVEDDGAPADDDLQLARALAGLAGIALANARQCRRLAQLARLKGDALNAMAHDLRAPLNALVGYASLLGEGSFGPVPDEQREISGILERQAVELVDLLGATLDVARLETGALPIREDEFVLPELLDHLRAGTFARASREGRLDCIVAPDVPALRTDRVKVKEILQNLIDNALKHAGGQQVRVDLGVAPDGETIRIVVQDTGPGIAPALLPHLFEPFRAGDAPGGGTGFGLYIVRTFTEALGGRVTARTGPGQGTTVTVELPISR